MPAYRAAPLPPRIRLDPGDGVATVYVSGDLDLFAAETLDHVLADVVAGQHVIVECADVEFMDSSGLRILMIHWRRLHATGGRLQIHDPSTAVRDVIELFGVDDLLL
ncbi:MAG TPA: STAS domain-containing protein [Ilumatobacteraceae bacterium]|nr:STAS domain-containing protein [Ilumatobacteraceae bacterium]